MYPQLQGSTPPIKRVRSSDVYKFNFKKKTVCFAGKFDNRKLTFRLDDKRDYFNFPIVNFPFLSSNIPSAPAYGVYVSQLIRYARTCSNYQDFMERGKVLTTKLLSEGCQTSKLVATLKKFYWLIFISNWVMVDN